jgi:hypothetical protein
MFESSGLKQLCGVVIAHLWHHAADRLKRLGRRLVDRE